MNRCTLVGANGKLDLSVPVVGGREIKAEFSAVKISYKEDWQTRHYRTIVSAYNRSPWFYQYEKQIKSLYEEKTEYLHELNRKAHFLVCGILKTHIGTECNVSSLNDKMEDMRGSFLPKNPNPFSIQEPVYTQVFSDRLGFVPGLSILDLVFCEGLRAGMILRSAAKQA